MSEQWMRRLDRIVYIGVPLLVLSVALAVLWAAMIGPALDCRARGGDPYWRRDHWWQRYGTMICEIQQ